MSKVMNGGFVYGLDHISELTEMSNKNINKHNAGLVEDGKVIFKTQDGRLGNHEHAPYDCIHIGAAVKEIPRKLFS